MLTVNLRLESQVPIGRGDFFIYKLTLYQLLIRLEMVSVSVRVVVGIGVRARFRMGLGGSK